MFSIIAFKRNLYVDQGSRDEHDSGEEEAGAEHRAMMKEFRENPLLRIANIRAFCNRPY